jgi:trk system potassium uptake protein TrkA
LAEKLTSGVVVLGLGRFGRSLALELMASGDEVLGIDADARIVQQLAGRLTHVVEGDTTNEDTLRQLGVDQFDRAVVGMGTDLEASILTASVLLHLGVTQVWAKAISASHARILSQIGVHHVIRPEHDMGKRVAHLVRGRMLDYIEFDDGYAFVRTLTPKGMHGRSLSGYGVRQLYGVTVVGVKPAGGSFTYATPETVLHEGDELIVSGPAGKVEAFAALT